MTRWNTQVTCPRQQCDGLLEAWLEEIVEVRPGHQKAIYLFCCSSCDLQGEWERLAKQHLAGVRSESASNVRRGY